MTYHTRLCTKD